MSQSVWMPADATLDLEVLTEAPNWLAKLPNVVELCRTAACAAFSAAGRHRLASVKTVEACLLLSDDSRVRALNNAFRGRDEPTNVLSFPSVEPDVLAATGADGLPATLGDIVIAFETTAAEAALEAKPLSDHLTHLVVHGMLHLLGYDHTTDGEASEMEALEVQVLATLGIAGPYSSMDEH
jgi:probable rRNA maturation factor